MTTTTNVFGLLALGMFLGKAAGLIDVSWWLVILTPFVPLAALLVLFAGLAALMVAALIVGFIVTGSIWVFETIREARVSK